MPFSDDHRSNASPDGRDAQHGIVAAGAFLLGWLRTLVNVIVITLLCVMIGLILIQILGRYVFNFSIAWSEETATFAQVWLVMLGAGVAMRNRQHVGIDMLIVLCPTSVQRVAKATSVLLIVWFLFVVISGSFALITIGLILKSPALQVPMAIPYLALPVGMIYFLLEMAIATLPEIRNPVPPPATSAGGVE